MAITIANDEFTDCNGYRIRAMYVYSNQNFVGFAVYKPNARRWDVFYAGVSTEAGVKAKGVFKSEARKLLRQMALEWDI